MCGWVLLRRDYTNMSDSLPIWRWWMRKSYGWVSGSGAVNKKTRRKERVGGGGEEVTEE
jgi:hypothetical protein